MSVLDIVFLALILILIIRCVLKGFIAETLAVASLVLGIFCAVFFFKNGAVFIREKFNMDMNIVPEVLAFIAIFLIVFILIRILLYLLQDIIKRANLGGIDRFLGLFFGAIEGITLVALLTFLLLIQPLFDANPLIDQSIVAKTIQSVLFQKPDV